MLMDVHRVEGIKYNFDRLTDDELVSMRGYLVETHRRVTDEIALVERTLFERAHPQLPIESGYDNYACMLGGAVLAGEIDCQQAYDALGGYGGTHEQAV